MAVSRRLRFEILKRDNHTCRYCGASAPDVKLTVDHVVPTTLGGNDEPTNLVAACQPCNAGKSSTSPDAPLVADVKQDALRWAMAIELAGRMMLAEREIVQDYIASFHETWQGYTNGVGRTCELPDEWQASIERFYQRGLPREILLDALHKAMANRSVVTYEKFRYMAGICWKRLTELEDSAAEIIEGEDA